MFSRKQILFLIKAFLSDINTKTYDINFLSSAVKTVICNVCGQSQEPKPLSENTKIFADSTGSRDKLNEVKNCLWAWYIESTYARNRIVCRFTIYNKRGYSMQLDRWHDDVVLEHFKNIKKLPNGVMAAWLSTKWQL